jgi:hypothetical protein
MERLLLATLADVDRERERRDEGKGGETERVETGNGDQTVKEGKDQARDVPRAKIA